MKWEGFEQFVGTLQKYGKVLIGGATVIQGHAVMFRNLSNDSYSIQILENKRLV